ncbi:MSMEG_0568 family radical SAM protein [Geodermatophilus ruber]|uniref:Radical SAM protein, MSMEG_0568 family n=1 Tax=Geodermatophilus ruber TaxID=504800 RepID=A0A1I4BLW8_9ACTN|nr:MSMEG_0568 family radical SAM protein [Geodermatophilus ruber]SFK69370.1 radical SAM protein, MSMEG_0568 family [Geodermatophilus ruber]
MTVTADTPTATAPPPALSAEELAQLLTAVQSSGLRVEVPLDARAGGAGPADAGMLYIEGVQTTVPTNASYVADSPYALRGEDDGSWGVYRDGVRLAGAALAPRPKYYDLTTADGIPYHQIALLHLDSMASTVLQTCAYWGNDDQCAFCGIGVTLAAGRTIAKKTPAMLAEVAVAARDLDGAVDATLTTGSTATPDRGAMYVARCGEAVKQAAGLPVQVQFEPPADLDVIDRVADMGIDSVGIHVETFDPAVLARVAPGKARWGIEAYFSAWERAVKAFGSGQVSTYVILGMGEDEQTTIDGCKRAIDLGVYPFIVPLRPVPGSLMEDLLPPPREAVEAVYRKVVPYLAKKGMSSAGVAAGCARCQACSGIGAFERMDGGISDGRPSLPLFTSH